MIEQVKIKGVNEFMLVDCRDKTKIADALTKILYVPDVRLKPYIINVLMEYLDSRFSKKKDNLRVYIAYNGPKVVGYITTEIHPGYTTRNRQSAIFGWLHADDFNICKALIEACESFAREKGMKLMRGSLNFPKSLGGFGIQEMGFEERMLFGVPFTKPNSRITEYLEKLGYQRDAEYVCMVVTKNSWEMGKVLDNSIKIQYLTPGELINRKDEIETIGRNAFVGFLPDSLGDNRFDKFMEIFAQVPKSHYVLPENFDPRKFSTQAEFLEAWESCELENVNTFVHVAFSRITDEVVGIIFCLPDLYQLWLEEPITRVNVDTVLVKKEYARKGIFSSLNNIGQLTGNINGITYYEGTGIWMVNEDAVKTILPHGRINRRFYVWQKRLKKEV